MNGAARTRALRDGPLARRYGVICNTERGADDMTACLGASTTEVGEMEAVAVEISARMVAGQGPVRTFAQLRERACQVGPRRVGVVQADDDVALTAVSEAMLAAMASPVLIGNGARIRERMAQLGLAELERAAEIVKELLQF